MRRATSQSRLGLIAGLTVSLLLSACASTFSGDTIDYKSAGEKKGPSLAFPPDMTVTGGDKRYVVPDGGATLSGYSNAVKTKPTGKEAILPAVAGMRIERDGTRRWLVVNKPAKELYPSIRDFWQETGFILMLDSPETGIMETDWAENRAKIPNDIIRSTIGRLFDSLYSTSERDKFRTRLERNSQGETEIFISHRGVAEIYTDANKDQTAWQPRPSDPELETEFLRRLMIRLGVGADQAKTLVATGTTAKPVASIATEAGQSVVRIEEGFDRAWRRVGLALDRTGFTVEDRDRKKGIYFVRYVSTGNPNTDAGFFSKLFSGSSKNADALKYQIAVVTKGDVTTVTVQNEQGTPDSSDTAKRIVKIIADGRRFDKAIKKPPCGGFFIGRISKRLGLGRRRSVRGWRSCSGRRSRSRCVGCRSSWRCGGCSSGCGCCCRCRSFFFLATSDQCCGGDNSCQDEGFVHFR